MLLLRTGYYQYFTNFQLYNPPNFVSALLVYRQNFRERGSPSQKIKNQGCELTYAYFISIYFQMKEDCLFPYQIQIIGLTIIPLIVILLDAPFHTIIDATGFKIKSNDTTKLNFNFIKIRKQLPTGAIQSDMSLNLRKCMK